MSEAHHATQTANAITYSAISAPMRIVIGRAFSIWFSRRADSLLRKRGLPTPTDGRECPSFSSTVCSARTAPTPDGQCNQSSLAALFQVRS